MECIFPDIRHFLEKAFYKPAGREAAVNIKRAVETHRVRRKPETATDFSPEANTYTSFPASRKLYSSLSSISDARLECTLYGPQFYLLVSETLGR